MNGKSTNPVLVSGGVPAGAFLELNVDLIDEGRFRVRLDQAIRRGVQELLQYEKDGDDRKGKAEIQVKLVIKRVAGTEEFFEVRNRVKVSVPIVERSCAVKERGGHLLCQPSGASEHDPNQMTMFNGRGEFIGKVDTRTGEVVEEEAKAVAGKVG